jgi:hypothetical protein
VDYDSVIQSRPELGCDRWPFGFPTAQEHIVLGIAALTENRRFRFKSDLPLPLEKTGAEFRWAAGLAHRIRWLRNLFDDSRLCRAPLACKLPR